MDKWNDLKKRVEELERKRERALGMRQAALDRVKAMGLNSIEEAEAALTQHQKEYEALKQELTTRMDDLEREIKNIESTCG